MTMYIHNCLGQNIEYTKFKDTIYHITARLNSISPISRFNSDSKADKILIEAIINSHFFRSRTAIIKYNYWINQNTGAKGLIEEIRNIDVPYMDLHMTLINTAAYAAYFRTLFILDEDFVRKNLDKLLPDLVNGNNLQYYVAWSFFLIDNSVKELLNISIHKLISFFNNLKKLSLPSSNPLYLLSVNAIWYPFIFNQDKDGMLFESFLKTSSSEIRSRFLIEIIKTLKNIREGRSSIKIDINILKKLIDNGKFKRNSELLDLFLYSPFDEEYSLTFLSKYIKEHMVDIKRNSICHKLYNVILELSEYSQFDDTRY